MNAASPPPRFWSPAHLAEALMRRRVVIDVLVNNADVLEQGAFVDLPAQAQQNMVALNVQGLTAMLSAFVPSMVRRGQGRVLNVASIAAFQPLPSLAVYAATKAYVLVSPSPQRPDPGSRLARAAGRPAAASSRPRPAVCAEHPSAMAAVARPCIGGLQLQFSVCAAVREAAAARLPQEQPACWPQPTP